MESVRWMRQRWHQLNSRWNDQVAITFECSEFNTDYLDVFSLDTFPLCVTNWMKSSTLIIRFHKASISIDRAGVRNESVKPLYSVIDLSVPKFSYFFQIRVTDDYLFCLIKGTCDLFLVWWEKKNNNKYQYNIINVTYWRSMWRVPWGRASTAVSSVQRIICRTDGYRCCRVSRLWSRGVH